MNKIKRTFSKKNCNICVSWQLKNGKGSHQKLSERITYIFRALWEVLHVVRNVLYITKELLKPTSKENELNQKYMQTTSLRQDFHYCRSSLSGGLLWDMCSKTFCKTPKKTLVLDSVFPVNFAKCLRAPFLRNILGRLLLSLRYGYLTKMLD